jgi:hypothetical protein
MKKIKLTKNKYALVDNDDFDWINKLKWIAEKIGNNWYASRSGQNGNKKMIRMHRLIMNFPKQLIDHIDGNGLNNQRKNLRLANKSINAINSKIRNTNKSGYKGIFWNKKSKLWQVSITKNYKKINLGTYKNKKEAIIIRKLGEKKYYENA